MFATSANAGLGPLRKDAREASLLRVRAGDLVVPPAQQRGLTRVIVRLAAPPLAAWNAQRTLATASQTQRLNVHSTASQAYVSRLQRAQAAAVAAVRAAIPSATIQERYSILLDGFAVQLPAKSLAKLVRLSSVTKVYPSLAYFATMDRGPSVIHATDLESTTGDRGQGVKIGVVDTRVDPTRPFLNPPGFS
jgi:hypothetical protein